jgi:hypothetical protein
MRKILYPRFGNSSPSLIAGPEIVTTSAPALIPFGNGIDLDYLPLILFEKGIMDRYSLEYIRYSGVPWLKGARESVVALHEEGFLEADLTFRDFLDVDKTLLIKADDDSLGEYKTWVPIAQRAAKHWKVTSSELESSLGIQLGLFEKTPYGIIHFITERGLQPTANEIARLERLFFDHSANTRRKDAQEIQRHVVRCYLSSVHACLRLAHRLDASWYDWENMRAFYERKSLQTLATSPFDPYIKTGRVFFQNFSAFRPRNTSQLIRLLRDQRIVNLRAKISELSISGEIIDDKFLNNALVAMENAKSKVQRLVDLSGYLTSFIPVPLVGKAVEKGIEKIASQHFLPPHRYLFFTGLLR